MLYTYNPGAVTAVVGGNIMRGYSDGTFIAITRNKDSYTLKMGVDGIGTRAKSLDRSARITLTLMQSSPSNDVLSSLALLDEKGDLGAVPFLLRDARGTTLASALTCWVLKPADVEYAAEVSDRAWVIETDSLQLFVGGLSV